MTGKITLTEKERYLILDHLPITLEELEHFTLRISKIVRALIETDQPPEWCEWTRDGVD
jgi:hypothetical protein